MKEDALIISEIQHYIESSILDSRIKLDPETNLQKAGVDSFSIVELIIFVQNNYNISIPDSQMLPNNFKTIQSMAQLVLKLSE